MGQSVENGICTQYSAPQMGESLGRQSLEYRPMGLLTKTGHAQCTGRFRHIWRGWFARPADRPTKPDNRVECQSFTKGRALAVLFEDQASTGPPPQCREFMRGANSLRALISFTSATDAPISALVISRYFCTKTRPAPEYTDPVFQYVGLLGTTNPSRTLAAVMTGTVPLVLQPETFLNFDRQNRYLEDRSLHRYAAQLSDVELSWLKARLWEQLRRFESRYASQPRTALVKYSDSSNSHEAPKLSDNPESPLHRSASFQNFRRGDSSAVHPEFDLRFLPTFTPRSGSVVWHRLKKGGTRRSAMSRLSAKHLDEWSTFLKQIPDESEAAFAYLHQAQNYYDLAVRQFVVHPKTPIPIAPVELLELKRSVLREESPRRASRASQSLVKKTRTRPTASKRSLRTNGCPRRANRRPIAAFGIDHRLHDSPSGPTVTIKPGTPALWGADGAVEANLLVDTQTNRLAASLGAALYLETQGEYRSELNPPTRDLKVFAIRVETTPELPVEVTLTPIALHQRRGLFGFSRLGAYGDLSGGVAYDERVFGLIESTLGPSVQAYSGSDGRADLSVGALARTGYRPSIGWLLEPWVSRHSPYRWRSEVCFEGWVHMPLSPGI